MITIIAGIGKNNELGKNNDLLWHLSADLKRFKKVTSGHHIIMGRKTFESIGKPLPNRTSIIITRNDNYFVDGCLVANNIQNALDLVENDDEVFIIGGAQIYQQDLQNNLIDKLDITHVDGEFDADVFFPEIDNNLWKEISRESHEKDVKNEFNFSFVTYVKR